jgi:hypothetical protein
MSEPAARATGGCLCGAVRYEVHGDLRDVLYCHCRNCRRFHGHTGAYAATARESLVFTTDRGLKWYRSPLDVTPNVHRGFCRECGSSLFWDPRDGDSVCIAAGTIDSPTDLQSVGHVWLSEAGDYYEINDSLEKCQKAPGGRHGVAELT